MGLDSGVIREVEMKSFHADFCTRNRSRYFSNRWVRRSSANFVVKPTFDFTVGGLFSPFTDYQQFLLAQAFEDTGVRAYKGQAANLMSKPDLLTAALQIHSVEARHASEVRRLRGQKDGLLVKIVEDCGFRLKELMMGNEPFRLDLILQRLMDPLGQYSYRSGSESFDEPLTTQQVVNIANLFIV
jgi:hypothetical protein